MTADCGTRNSSRLTAHVDCYSECNFWGEFWTNPGSWPFPEVLTVGLTDLTWDFYRNEGYNAKELEAAIKAAVASHQYGVTIESYEAPACTVPYTK